MLMDNIVGVEHVVNKESFITAFLSLSLSYRHRLVRRVKTDSVITRL